MSLRQKIVLLATVFISLFFQVLPQIRNGLSYDFGLGFWGPSGHDMIWHLSLSQMAQNPLTINHPTFSGQFLQNYHPFYNFLINFLSSITSLSLPLLSLQIFPIITALGIIILSYLLGKKLFGYWGGVLLIIFNTFSSSLGWLVSLLRNQNFYGESIFWSMQSASTHTNPPYALSLVFLLYGLLILAQKILHPRHYLSLFLISLLLPVTKAYSALLWFPLLFLFLIPRSPNLKKIIFFTLTSSVSYLAFSYYNSSSTSLFEFQPFWFINSLIDSPDRLYLPKLSAYRFNLNFPDPRLLAIEFFVLILFVLGNYSWRILGFFKSDHPHQFFRRSIIATAFFLFVIPLFFTQKGNTWNSIQFLYYSLFLSNILLVDYFVDQKFKLRRLKLLFLVILFFVLGNLGTYQTYFGNPPPTAIYPKEVEALNFLSQQDSGIILTYPYDKYLKNQFSQTPIPLYAYETSAYVTAYTAHPTFLADEMNLQISGYHYQDRLQSSNQFFLQDPNLWSQNRGFLVNNQIDYIYLVDSQISKTSLDLEKMSLSLIFNNGYVNIYRVAR